MENNNSKINFIPLFIIFIVFLFLTGIYFLQTNRFTEITNKIIPQVFQPKNSQDKFQIKKFASEKEFIAFFKKNQAVNYNLPVSGGGGEIAQKALPAVDITTSNIGGRADSSVSYETASRQSTTNVQVIGIDEPDIVKTDGQNIYFSKQENRLYQPMIEKRSSTDIYPYYPPQQQAKTLILKALPAESLSKISELENSGELILKDKMLIIIDQNQRNIVGYNISNPLIPEKKWSYKLNSQTEYITGRLYNNRIFLITKNYINDFSPCSFKPYSFNNKEISIACTDIYYPDVISFTDSLYTISKIDPVSGNIENKTSFVGSANGSIIYMSQKNIYVTYQYTIDYNRLIIDFYLTDGNELLPQSIIRQLRRVYNYELSNTAKSTEFNQIIEQYRMSLTDDQRLKYDNDYQNSYSKYNKRLYRKLFQSGIAKINADNLNFEATGTVAGNLLNQFAIDEYNGYLRVATNIPRNWNTGTDESTNDLYILDNNLNITGQIKDIKKGEQIYSVRFIKDKGYIVTFRQTDPFFVIDLSDVGNPVIKGELKIPGFSSYLHPITDNIILGVGQENFKVKLSLFDVTRPENPLEIDKYLLTDGWTEVSDNHKAFLQDSNKQIFFIPGSSGGYVFSYSNNKLNLLKAISGYAVKRAVYINDNFYILSESEVAVFDENNWQEIKRIEFD